MLVDSVYSSIGNIAQGYLDQFINSNAFEFGGINENSDYIQLNR